MAAGFLPNQVNATTWYSIVDDTFNRSDTSVAGVADSTAGVGNGWIDTNGSVWNISSNLLQGTSNLSSDYLSKFLLRPSSENATNQRIVAVVPANENISGQFLGIALRWQSGTSNYYLAHIGTNGLFIYKIIGGATTLVSSKSLSLSASNSYQIEFAATGTSPTNIYLGVTNLTSNTFVDSINTTDSAASLQTSGRYGLTTWYNTGAHVIRSSRIQTFTDTPSDTVAPVISAIASTTNQTTATITWTTDENSSSVVNFGTTSSYGTASTSSLLSTSHSILLTGLTAGTTYHFQVSSTDAGSNTATSSDLTFTTTAGATINPVGYWPLDEEISSSNAADAIGTNTGFQTGSPDISTSTPNVTFSDPRSRVFDGNNYLTINRPVQDNFTICAWIKTSSTGGGSNHWQSAPIMDSEWGGLAYDFGFGIGNGGKLMFGNGGSSDSQVNGATTINDNVWHNVCVTRNGTSGAVKLYVDAQLDGSGTTATGSLTRNPYARIGYGYDGAAHYVGLIDDVRAYDIDLSQTQLLSIFQGNNDPSTPPDSTAPAISNIATSTTSSSATITWETDENASSKVVYSSDTTFASSTVEVDISPRITDHETSLSGLLSCTLYNFKVVSADAVGNRATSTANSFITNGCSGGSAPSSATSTSISVNSDTTSTATDSGRTITVTTPANFTATSSSVVIQIKGLASTDVINSIGKPLGSLSSAATIAFDVTALIDNVTTLDSFDMPVTIAYTYTDADVSNLDESTLSMYHYHDGSWLQLDACSVNVNTNTITCEAPSFSVFAIFGSPLSSSSGVRGGSATSVQRRVANLFAMGKPAEATMLKQQWYWLFPTETIISTSSVLFTRNLTLHDEGVDVRNLQKFLNSQGFVLASAGPGSPGNETSYFGGLTQKALISYQKANGIFPSIGYLGPITRAKIGMGR